MVNWDWVIKLNAPNINKVDKFDSIGLLKVHAGYKHSAILTKSGEVYVFGKWDKTVYTKPHRVNGLNSVVDISTCWLTVAGPSLAYVFKITDGWELSILLSILVMFLFTKFIQIS